MELASCTHLTKRVPRAHKWRGHMSIFWTIVSINMIFFIDCSHQYLHSGAQSISAKAPKQPATNMSSAQSEGVEDILKDTMLLLDVLDEKLSAVKNKTPNAMMRDNLRALDGANEEAEQHQQTRLRDQQSERSLNERELDEASMEAALVKMADGFASDRRSDHDTAPAVAAIEPLLTAAATSSVVISEEPKAQGGGPSVSSSSRQLINHRDRSTEEAELSSMAGEDVNQQQLGAARGGSKRARQLVNGGSHMDDNNELASDSTERHIKFTLDLMQSIFSSQSYSAKTNLIESFLISPLSIQMVLMMMHLGARGQTKREISNCLHLSSPVAPSSPATGSYGSSTNPNKSLITMQQQQQLHHHQQIVGAGPLNAATDDLAAAASGAADSMSFKLKRRHQQQQLHVSSENAKQHSASSGNSNSKSQQQQPTGANLRQQQMASSPAASSVSLQQQAAAAAAPNTAGGAAANPHELFGGAMRNLLKDPIVMKALTNANQIFLQKNLPLSAQYEWSIRHYYAADVKLVDFQHQSSTVAEKSKQHLTLNNNGAPGDYLQQQNSSLANVTLVDQHKITARADEQSASGHNNIQQMVNDWIERQTKGKISNFLSSPVSTSTLMMAINVLYFKGDWQYKFDPSDTETDAWFTQANGKSVKIPMMVNRLPLAFAHDPAMKTSVIELPYKAQRLGLFLLLPDEVSGIFHTMQMLNSTSFANLISSMRKPSPGADHGSSGINVRIPKFSIDSSPRLSQILSQQLGLKSLFMPDVADLSGMFAPFQQSKRSAGNSSNAQNPFKLQENTEYNNQQVPLQVGLDELLHKAVLQVDEQGSVAAASSATIVERVGLFNSNYFEADHPFLLFLMDKQTGLVLFSGVFAGNNNSNTPNNQESQQQRLH